MCFNEGIFQSGDVEDVDVGVYFGFKGVGVEYFVGVDFIGDVNQGGDGQYKYYDCFVMWQYWVFNQVDGIVDGCGVEYYCYDVD